MAKGKKREATPKAPKVSPAAVDAPPAPRIVTLKFGDTIGYDTNGKPFGIPPKPPAQPKGGRPKGWKPSEHGANPGGRPVEWTEERIEALGDRLVEWAQSHDALYLESFCKKERTYPQKLSELAAKNQKFSESLKIAKCANAANIGEAVAAGEIPPAVGIFGLKQHGHSEKHEIEHSGEIKGSGVIEIHLPAKRE